jgi:putative Mg2+ transporter-C (MgtC) family protein
MNQFFEAINSTDVTFVSSIFKLFLSLVLGAVVGFERRQKGQIAGMRTFSLIAMGATLAMIVSIYIPQEYLGLKNGDPGRIAAQVISGIGFLGAGAIIQMKGSVRGLTTAAGIWMTACLGLAVGSGMYLISTVACILILVVYRILEQIEKIFLKSAEQKIVRIKIDKIVTDGTPYRNCFSKFRVHISDEFLRYDYTQGVTTINFMVRSKDDTDFIGLFECIRTLGDTLSITLTNEVNN